MKNIIASTRLYKNYQLAIPKANINEDNDIVIRPRKKVCLEDVLGIIEDDDSRDAVELKRSLYKWKIQLNLKGACTNDDPAWLLILDCDF